MSPRTGELVPFGRLREITNKQKAEALRRDSSHSRVTPTHT